MLISNSLFLYGYSECCSVLSSFFFCFFFNDTSTTEIYTLSLHDALPIWLLFQVNRCLFPLIQWQMNFYLNGASYLQARARSEEHTSELQSQSNLVCRLLLEKKKSKQSYSSSIHSRSLHSASTFFSTTTYS